MKSHKSTRTLSLLRPVHHDLELFKVYLAVPVAIDLLDVMQQLVLGHQVLQVFALQHRQHFVFVYFTTAVLVEHRESRANVVVAEVNLRIHSCREELSIFDGARIVRVGCS